MLKLGILDQSPISEGMNAETAINNTIELAKFADINGYSRFWVSEHHGSRAFASASPEIFITSLAGITKNLRLGTAGILLSHYSPFKIAEQMSLLSTLYPNRIDLGIGRALGGDPKIVKLLYSDSSKAFERYDELIELLQKNRSGVRVVPETDHKPELWVLGSSLSSAKYAAERGLRYSFASFINAEQLIQSFQTYHQYFTPSEFLSKPYTNLALFVLCAQEEERANDLANVAEEWLVNSLLYKKDLPFPQNVGNSSITDSFPAQLLLKMFREYSAIGNPKQVLKKISSIQRKIMVDEFTLVTITHNQEDKIESFKLIAQENKKG